MSITTTQEDLLQSYLGFDGCFTGAITERNENWNLRSTIRYLQNAQLLNTEAFNRFIRGLQLFENPQLINALKYIHGLCHNEILPFQYHPLSVARNVKAIEHFFKGTGIIDAEALQQKAHILVGECISRLEGLIVNHDDKHNMEIEDLRHRIAELPADYIFKHSSSTLDDSLPVTSFSHHGAYVFFPCGTRTISMRQYLFRLIESNFHKALTIVEAMESFDRSNYQFSRKKIETALGLNRNCIHYGETTGQLLYRLLLNEPQTISEMTICLSRVNKTRSNVQQTWRNQAMSERQSEYLEKLQLYSQEYSKISFSYQQHQNYYRLYLQGLCLQFRNMWPIINIFRTHSENVSSTERVPGINLHL